MEFLLCRGFQTSEYQSGHIGKRYMHLEGIYLGWVGFHSNINHQKFTWKGCLWGWPLSGDLFIICSSWCYSWLLVRLNPLSTLVSPQWRRFTWKGSLWGWLLSSRGRWRDPSKTPLSPRAPGGRCLWKWIWGEISVKVNLYRKEMNHSSKAFGHFSFERSRQGERVRVNSNSALSSELRVYPQCDTGNNSQTRWESENEQ